MRSLERIFNKIKQENPLWSDYICFAETVKGRKFARQTIGQYFNRLVDKNEYDKRDNKSLLKQLPELAQGERRPLSNIVLDKLQLNNGKLNYTFSKPFELRSKAIKETNSSKEGNSIDYPAKIFGLQKIRSNRTKNRDFLPVCPVWRRRWDDFRTFKWVDSIDSPELMIKPVQKLLQLYY